MANYRTVEFMHYLMQCLTDKFTIYSVSVCTDASNKQIN